VWHYQAVGNAVQALGRRQDEGRLWLDFDDLGWFPPEVRRRHATTVQSRTAAIAMPLPAFAGAGGLAAPFPSARPRRAAETGRQGWSAERRRRFAKRFMPTATLAVAAAGAAPWVTEWAKSSPELTFREPIVEVTSAPRAQTALTLVEREPRTRPVVDRAATPAAEQATRPYPEIAWRTSTAVGAAHNGRLVDGVGLPITGPDWVTWDPALDRSPNRASRLYGTDFLMRSLLQVIEDYRAAHPNAPRVVVGDLSRRGGGPIDEHVSHENGLDVDVYYPRLDGKPLPPSRVAQVDLKLAQDLIDRFVASGAQVIFVGQHVHLHGPAGVVVPYPNHDNHLHVRMPASG
jgi:murein endopeptidase